MAVKKREVRHAAEKYFKNIIRAANELECPKISITSGWQQFSETREEAWNRSVDMIGDLCQFAQPYGICLTMETLSPQSTKLVNYLNDMKQMIQDVNSNQLTVTADIHTIHNAGENLQDYFDSFGKRLNHCHFMDYKKDVFAHLALGDGEADLKNILSVFKKNGYEGDFVLEYTDAKYFRNPHKAYEKTMKILRDVL
jgi:protein FrlC